ncbi:PRKRIP1 family protein [Aspergillus homomorphus CBS 101889]|uniref:DUF1168-domain-containing protein n=1 Tax=Aspergillus homomorphus (strain CBS 101889) TaxID=1450537 RepID=A0A395HHY3_ASPHC|nr:hypothetical protein BO97DRAFT_447119 [Aspergillus homomorphus CBS 101889]RAL07113.1 hypothetical protein BO97DRAFT_447119 [Aspergillus homomorphus CBS 101889]
MSEPIPESIPTSADPRSKRPTKRRAVGSGGGGPSTAHSEQATQIESLFRDPTREIRLPEASKQRTSASLPPPPEIVANVQGSSAGAGSGEFHVYKASRRREYERLRLMQSEVTREKEDEGWERKQAETRRKDEEKTEKNRKRREKRNAKKKNLHPNGPGNGDAKKGAAGGDPMAVDRKDDGLAASNNAMLRDADGAGYGDADGSGETPGIIIHED